MRGACHCCVQQVKYEITSCILYQIPSCMQGAMVNYLEICQRSTKEAKWYVELRHSASHEMNNEFGPRDR